MNTGLGLGLCVLEADGRVDLHVHSFEESFYVLEGQPTLILDGRGYRLQPGACGVAPVGVPHAWLGPESGVARWIDMLAPQPRDDGLPEDTFFLGALGEYEPVDLDVRDPRSRHLFRFADAEIVLDNLKAGAPVDAPTVSASDSTVRWLETQAPQPPSRHSYRFTRLGLPQDKLAVFTNGRSIRSVLVSIGGRRGERSD